MLNVQNYFYFVRFYVDLFWNAGKISSCVKQ